MEGIVALRIKPNVFVMSSSPGRTVADAVVEVLRETGELDVVYWPGAFAKGAPYMETLRTATLRFDFGVLVITPDDTAHVRSVKVTQPRDNVIFELGLFLSALGPRRALPILVSKGGKHPSLPTDLLGVEMVRVDVRPRRPVRKEIEEAVAELRALMISRHKVPEYGLLPATALAIGYFVNFVQPLLQGIGAYRELRIGNRQHRVPPGAWRLSICIPDSLREATRERWAEVADQLSLEQAQVEIPKEAPMLRPYPFRVSVSRSDGVLAMYDTPTTLRTAYDSVRKLMPNASQRDLDLADERSVSDFESIVQRLMEENGLPRERVELLSWSELHGRHAQP